MLLIQQVYFDAIQACAAMWQTLCGVPHIFEKCWVAGKISVDSLCLQMPGFSHVVGLLSEGMTSIMMIYPRV